MSLVIEEIRGLGDPQKSYKWRVTMPFINSNQTSNSVDDFLSNRPNTRNAVAGITNRVRPIVGSRLDQTRFGSFINSFNPSDYVEEVSGLPFPNTDRESFYEGGRNTYFPGIEDLQTFTVSFFQDESSKIQDYFFQWKRLIINVDGTKNYPSNYKKSIRIQLLDGRNRPVYDYRLVGCFPTQTSPYNLDNSSNRLIWSQEFSADRLEIITSSRPQRKDDIADRLKNKVVSEVTDNSNFANGISTNITDNINLPF